MVLNNLKAIDNCSFKLPRLSVSKELTPPVIFSYANTDGGKPHWPLGCDHAQQGTS